jgi:hypothetical protein
MCRQIGLVPIIYLSRSSVFVRSEKPSGAALFTVGRLQVPVGSSDNTSITLYGYIVLLAKETIFRKCGKSVP